MGRITYVLCVLFVLVVSPAFAEQWQVYTTDDGLPSDSVTSVYADRVAPGRIWIGTSEPGITMFYQDEFTEFPMPDLGWSRGACPGTICQRGDEIWLVSSGLGALGAIDVFFLDRERRWHMGPDTWGCWVYGLGTSLDGVVYVTTEDSLSSVSGSAENLSVSLIAFADSFDNPFWSQLVSRAGTVYVSSYRGDFYSFRNNELVGRERSGRFREMVEDSLGGLWAINDSWGDRCMHRPAGSSKWSFVDALDGFTCRQLSAGEDGDVLAFGHYNRGHASSSFIFMFFDGSDWKEYGASWVPGRVMDVCLDSEGNWWVATNAGLAVRWRTLPALPMFLGVKTDALSYPPGESMAVTVDLVAEGENRTVDLHVALETPSRELLFYPMFGTEMAPFISGVEIPADTHLEDYELFSLTLPELPAGTYRWFAACTHAGTMDFASNIASCEWQFE